MAARRVVGVFHEINDIVFPTGLYSPFDNQGEISDLSNRFSVAIENENPATSAKVNGVKDVVESVYCARDHTAEFPILARHWGLLA